MRTIIILHVAKLKSVPVVKNVNVDFCFSSRTNIRVYLILIPYFFCFQKYFIDRLLAVIFCQSHSKADCRRAINEEKTFYFSPYFPTKPLNSRADISISKREFQSTFSAALSRIIKVTLTKRIKLSSKPKPHNYASISSKYTSFHTA